MVLLRLFLLGLFLFHAFSFSAFAEKNCTVLEAYLRVRAGMLDSSEVADDLALAMVGDKVAKPGKFKMIVDPKEALAARVMMIRNATDTIDISYYIFKDTEASRVLLAELNNALRRGVNVRLMVDGSGTVTSSMKSLNSFSEIQTLMKVQGGLRPDGMRATFDPVVINPLFNVRANVRNWYKGVVKFVTGKDVPVDHFSMFQRSHEKILLTDAAIPEKSMALIGGRNIANDYFGIADGAKDTYNDLDILMKGVSTTRKTEGGLVVENAISDHFDKLYNFAANKRFNDFFLKVNRSQAATSLNRIRNERNALAGPSGQLTPMLEKMEAEKYLEEGFDEGQIAILNEFENMNRREPLKNTGERYTNPNSIMKNMWDQLGVAKKDILIGSPFLYFTDKEMTFLVKWLKEDPSRTLRILTNSTATSDALPAQALMEHFVMPKLLSELSKAGIPEKQYEILAYGTKDHPVVGGKSSQGKLHAKFWMVDNQAIGLGTSNFDALSRLTNSEIMANVFPQNGKTSVTSLNKFYNDLKKDSTRWGSEEFNAMKASPELKYRIWKQELIAKIVQRLNLLPQD